MGKIFTVTEKDNNTSLQTSVGDVVEVSLTWNPSTGYFWQSGDSTAGDIIEIKHEGGDPTPGANAVVYFKFKIKAAGVIELLYARPWSETSPNKWFTLRVTIGEQ